ncbi:hypothetical protein J3A83DRAFT_2998155 [Scleroderma citrinum]
MATLSPFDPFSMTYLASLAYLAHWHICVQQASVLLVHAAATSLLFSSLNFTIVAFSPLDHFFSFLGDLSWVSSPGIQSIFSWLFFIHTAFGCL